MIIASNSKDEMECENNGEPKVTARSNTLLEFRERDVGTQMLLGMDPVDVPNSLITNDALVTIVEESNRYAEQ